MSGSIFGTNTAIAFASTPLTDDEKIDIRRLCGYSLYGAAPSGFVGYRFFQAQGFLEYRMGNCAPGEAQRIRKLMAVIFPLEDAVAGAGDNLDTDVAAVWTRNRNEVRDRERLRDRYRIELCSFLGVPPGEGLASAGQGGRIVI